MGVGRTIESQGNDRAPKRLVAAAVVAAVVAEAVALVVAVVAADESLFVSEEKSRVDWFEEVFDQGGDFD